MNFQTQKIVVLSQLQRDYAIQKVKEVPLGVEIVFRAKTPQRRAAQNALQWASILGDFEEQVYAGGRQWSKQVWHEHLKSLFLPEKSEDGITLDGYQKYIEMPDGALRMIGSTTKLTVKGFAQYCEQCRAYGEQEFGIRFSAHER